MSSVGEWNCRVKYQGVPQNLYLEKYVGSIQKVGGYRLLVESQRR